MPPKISVELLPRSREHLLAEAAIVAQYPEVTHINVPDQEKFTLRSLDAVEDLRQVYAERFIYVPHLPALRLPEDPRLDMRDLWLVVQGDPPTSMRPCQSSTSRELIRFCAMFSPMAAAIDQYRGMAADELAYVKEKISLGAKIFFTQPFFSLRSLEAWETALLPLAVDVFYGVSPVTTEKSKAYWEKMNRVIFPPDFSPEWDAQIDFARSVIAWAKSHERSVYLMPIKVPLQPYLDGIFR